MKSVSVVVPTFNSAEYIARTIRAIGEQTLTPSEVIFVDDCSTDSTAAVIEGSIDLLARVSTRLIQLPKNSGPGVARNTGWNAASGDYVAFLDADDSWHPQKLEIQIAYMESAPWASFSGHHYLVSEQGFSEIFVTGSPGSREVRLHSFLIRNLFSTPSVVVRRNLKHRFSEDREMAEDYLLWLELLADGERALLIESKLVCLHKAAYGAGGLSGQLRRMELKDLRALRILQRNRRISSATFLLAGAFSYIKYVRRILRTKARL